MIMFGGDCVGDVRAVVVKNGIIWGYFRVASRVGASGAIGGGIVRWAEWMYL
jgi:hypothetical protein